MRRRAVIAPIVLLAAALLAWRRRRARAARRRLGAAPPAPPPVGARTPVASLPAPAPAEPPPPAPTRAAPPSPSGSRFVSVSWTLGDAPADRAELTVRYAAHPRLELDRVDAQETPTQVFVTVLLRPRAADADNPGDATTRQHAATVTLSGPLGTRELVHAPADPPPAAGDGPSGPPLYP